MNVKDTRFSGMYAWVITMPISIFGSSGREHKESKSLLKITVVKMPYVNNPSRLGIMRVNRSQINDTTGVQF